MIRETGRTVTLPSGEVLTPADFEQMADEVLTNPPEFVPVNPKGGRPSLADGISPTLRVRIDETTRQRLADRAAAQNTTSSKIVRELIEHWLAS